MTVQESIGVVLTFLGALFMGAYIQNLRQKSQSTLIDLKVKKEVEETLDKVNKLPIASFVDYLNAWRRRGK